ncbi:MAG: hypothetical protein A3K83_02830 [Omnitrophica WOR_2 bacterium RBG_13_44_8b]|nr:MAG: hypothetical protein A3K83_02830 [Omnitrophica WOR_2 bacterium RBG_13_44_8b]
MKLLLHTCCAPCMIYPLDKLRERNYEVEAYFYNPNIHPLEEYERRKVAVENYSLLMHIPLVLGGYNPDEFFEAVRQVPENPGRCPVCWYLRLKKTANMAKLLECQGFTTTLLVSPYQDQQAIIKIGSDIAKKEGLVFYYEDFRTGFREAHNKAHNMGIYCQKYCGCRYSEEERCRKSEKH